MGILKTLSTFFFGNSKKKKKMKHLFGRNGKEDMVIFSTQNGNPQFFTTF